MKLATSFIATAAYLFISFTPTNAAYELPYPQIFLQRLGEAKDIAYKLQNIDIANSMILQSTGPQDNNYGAALEAFDKLLQVTKQLSNTENILVVTKLNDAAMQAVTEGFLSFELGAKINIEKLHPLLKYKEPTGGFMGYGQTPAHFVFSDGNFKNLIEDYYEAFMTAAISVKEVLLQSNYLDAADAVWNAADKVVQSIYPLLGT